MVSAFHLAGPIRDGLGTPLENNNFDKFIAEKTHIVNAIIPTLTNE